MTLQKTTTASELAARIGQELGVSEWLVVDQARIDQFADVTEDHQFIHVDPARAKAETPFGGTIAHGFLTLSMLSKLGMETLPRVDGMAMGINAGFDRIRFLSPVPVGSRIRGRFRLIDCERPSDHELRPRYEATIDLEGSDKPALVAEWLTRIYLTPVAAKV